jgi:hypothetical protein
MTALHTGLHELTKELKKTGAGLGRGVSLHATVTALEGVGTNAIQFELEALFALHPAGVGVYLPNGRRRSCGFRFNGLKVRVVGETRR